MLHQALFALIMIFSSSHSSAYAHRMGANYRQLNVIDSQITSLQMQVPRNSTMLDRIFSADVRAINVMQRQDRSAPAAYAAHDRLFHAGTNDMKAAIGEIRSAFDGSSRAAARTAFKHYAAARATFKHARGCARPNSC